MHDISLKEADSPYIFSFPHSGERLIAEMDWQLKPEARKFLPNVDWHLPKLYFFLEQYKVLWNRLKRMSLLETEITRLHQKH